MPPLRVASSADMRAQSLAPIHPARLTPCSAMLIVLGQRLTKVFQGQDLAAFEKSKNIKRRKKMKKKHPAFSIILILSLFISVLISPITSVVPVLAAGIPIIDDFESGLPSGKDANGSDIGFVTFKDPNSSVAISTTNTPPTPVPGATDPNMVLKMDLSVVSYAGFVHNFENASVDTWVPQDWSAYEGISFWLYGNNSSTTMFIDVLDNRNPGSTRDDAERWSIDFPDNFSGWKEIKIPFASAFSRA